MKSIEESGGPAFPQDIGGVPHFGLSVRDYFAAEAMSGWLASFGNSGHPMATGSLHLLAEEAYAVADAMMKARES